MTAASEGLELRFLFDEHVNARAMLRLQAAGVDVLHVNDVGLARAEDGALFDWARLNSRIIVTRNYQDFAPLVEHANREGMSFPGVLFYAPSISQSDVGSHLRALEGWIAAARSAGRNPAENTFAWISSA